MATTIKTGPIHQSPHLVADYSNAISPFFVNGGIISKELVPDVDYPIGEDEVIIEIPGATSISFCELQNQVGTKIAHAVTNLSGTTGKVITIDPSTSTSVRCLILYTV